VVLGARTAAEQMLAWQFAGLGLTPLTATDDGSAGRHGTAVQVAAPLLADGWPTAVYACGPEAMVRALRPLAAAAGVPCWISLERVMRCGLGVCGSCHCGDRLVCADGPVFPVSILA